MEVSDTKHHPITVRRPKMYQQAIHKYQLHNTALFYLVFIAVG